MHLSTRFKSSKIECSYLLVQQFYNFSIIETSLGRVAKLDNLNTHTHTRMSVSIMRIQFIGWLGRI